MRMPPQIQLGQHHQTTMGAVLHMQKEAAKDPAFFNPYGKETVMGFVLPDFQRPPVWTTDQSIRFIESAWMGFPLGAYVYNSYRIEDDTPHPLSWCLIDGQQRLRAIERYVNNEFEVFQTFYSDLEEIDYRRFHMAIHFESWEANIWDEQKLRDLYNRLSFGGTPHTEDQRA